MKSSATKRSGFALIEIMVVIGIIGVLIAVAACSVHGASVAAP